MKIEGFDGGVEKRGVGSETTFTIDNSAYAFRVLSETLYSRKVQSVIRELSTNAADEHVSAGVADKPFDVHLPTMFECWFAIRDFGAGLSEADATSLYTTFFKSTKRDSNEVTGCLGLGSKSPFAVSDSFTVESFHGGRKTVYACFKEEGLPKLAKLSEEESSEPTGVRIVIPVQSDHWEWRYEAERVYKFFQVKPTINAVVDMALGTATLQGEGWSIHQGMDASFAVMGNVAYPIDFRAIKVESDTEDARFLSGFYHSKGLVLRYPLGTISFDPSRERLEYTKKTGRTILGTLRSIESELTGIIESKVESAADMFEARKAFVVARKTLFDLFSSSETDPVGFCRGLKDMKPTKGGKFLFEDPHGVPGEYSPRSRKVIVPVASKTYIRSRRRDKTVCSVGSPSSVLFDFGREATIYACAAFKGLNNRMRQHVLSLPPDANEVVLVEEASLQVLADRLGIADTSRIRRAETLPAATRGRSSASSMRVWSAKLGSRGLEGRERVSIGDEECWYVLRDRDGYRIEVGGGWCVDEGTFSDMLTIARKDGLDLPAEVVTLTGSEAARRKLDERDNMINLVETLVDHVHEVARESLRRAVEDSPARLTDAVGANLKGFHRDLAVVASRLGSDHPLRTLPEYGSEAYVDRNFGGVRNLSVYDDSGSRDMFEFEFEPDVVSTNAGDLYGFVDMGGQGCEAFLDAMHASGFMPPLVSDLVGRARGSVSSAVWGEFKHAFEKEVGHGQSA